MKLRNRIASMPTLLATACLALVACAADEAPNNADEIREVTITMTEYAFEASDTVFVAGVPYRFVLRNDGGIEHEWAIVPRGDTDESRLLFEVEEDDLPAGAVVVREFTFPEPGEYDFACYLEGHYEGGMVLPVRVVDTE